MYSIGSITEEDESLEESQASMELEDAVTTLQNFEKSVNWAIEAFKGNHRFSQSLHLNFKKSIS